MAETTRSHLYRTATELPNSEEEASQLFSAPQATNSFPLPSISSPHPPEARQYDTFTFCHPPPTTTNNNNNINNINNNPTRPTPTTSRTLPNISTTPGTRTHRRNRNNRSNPSYPPLSFNNPHFSTQAHLDRDGRVHIKLNHLPGRARDTPLSSLLDSTLKQQFSINLRNNQTNTTTPVLDSTPPRLNIVIMVIGSRGDIQPFVALAKVLVGEWGHRVRLATHPEFKEFIEEEFRVMEEEIEREEQESGRGKRGEEEVKSPGIKGGRGEFFSVGGDPQELMAFMVKNPGLLPSLETLKAGGVARRRQEMGIMFEGFWRSCVEPSVYAIEGEMKESKSGNREEDKSKKKSKKQKKAVIQRLPGTTPFIADAIIANPPSFAHVHCAEKLGIPLHLMFTFPYTPTTTIPHPLANISHSDAEAAYTNIISYSMVEMMTWQGLGDLVNRFRKETLGLEPLSTLWAPGLLARLKVPTTYMWSPSLIPKPADWGPHVDIGGFVFLGKADSFTPPDGLREFLEREPDNPPIYIGFGSIVVDDPDGLTHLIFDAVKEAGVRALVAKGWGGLGGEEGVPEEVFMLENTPHDWLFPKCRAVVHHGGAGTTAIGLKCGKPTFIVSFFGDQPFWGQMVKNAGAGDWSPFKEMDKERLVQGLRTITTGEVAGNAGGLAERIGKEGDGAKNAVMSFHRALETVGVSKNAGERGGRGRRGEEWRLDVPGEAGVQEVDEGVPEGVGGRRSGDGFGVEEEKKQGSQSPLSRVKLKFRRKKESHNRNTPQSTVPTEGLIINPSSNKESIQDIGIRCTILPEAVAVWRVKRTRIKLSAVAAYILVQEGKFTWKDLRLVRHTEWNDFDGPGDPLSGGAGVIVNALGGVAKGLFGVPYMWYKGVRRVAVEENVGAKREAEDRVLGQIVENSQEIRERERMGETGLEKEQAGKKEYGGRTSLDNCGNETDGEDPISKDILHGTTHSLTSILRTGLRLPMDISLALAQGFHNAPRLYGDKVRRPNRITGLHSGLCAAGKEVTLGLYDTVTGFAIKPYRGAKASGAVGFAKGVGMAVGGVVFAVGAGLAGTVGYTLQGVHKELHKGPERAVIRRIMDMRIWEGEREVAELRRRGRGDGDGGEWEGVRQRVIGGWEREEKREWEKKEGEEELMREMSGVREIGWGAAKLRQLKQREERRRKAMSRREKRKKDGREGGSKKGGGEKVTEDSERSGGKLED